MVTRASKRRIHVELIRDGLDLALVCIADRIDFLQRNDVRVQLRKHIYDSFETDAAIYSASLVNVVGNNPHGKFTCVGRLATLV